MEKKISEVRGMIDRKKCASKMAEALVDKNDSGMK